MLRPSYPIYTARLTLRPWTPDDFEDLLAIQSHPEVPRYLYWSVRDEAAVREDLKNKTAMSTLSDVGDALSLAVVWREAERVVGGVSLQWLSRDDGGGEVGYVFNPEFTGHGFATEAASAMLRLAFTQPVDGGLGLHRVVGRIDGRNAASARVLERLGMRREAHFVENEYVKGEWTDEIVYAILHREWIARRSAPPPRRAAPPPRRG